MTASADASSSASSSASSASSDSAVDPPGAGGLRQNLVIGALSVLVGAVVIPYGATMPYIREGIPGPGLFPMMIGGLLILLGVLLPLIGWLGARRELRHRAALAEITGAPAAGGPVAGAAVPAAAGDAPEDRLETVGVLDTDIGSDGARRWINGAILMGGIVFFVLFAELLGFPLTMAVLVIAIVRSLRARWAVAVTTGVLTALGLWALFELVLMVQLPDGLLRGF